MDNGRERYHRRAVENYRRGESCHWITCLAAERIVGKYNEGDVTALASDIALSKRQVYNLAKAGWLYRLLRKVHTADDVHHLRNNTTIKHFYSIAQAMIAHDLPITDVIEQLRTAADEGASVESMMASINGEHERDDMWTSRYDRMVKCAELLKDDDNAPVHIREIAIGVLRMCQVIT